MDTAVLSFLDANAATAFGLAGLSAQLVWPLFRCRETILTIQLGGACSYAASYAVLGQETATAVCLTGAIQTTVALLAGDRSWLSRLGFVFLPFVMVIGLVTFSGLPTILAVTACCLIMLGRLQRDTLRMRSIQLAAAPFGAGHDIVVGAWPCLAGAAVSFLIATTALRREWRARQSEEQPT